MKIKIGDYVTANRLPGIVGKPTPMQGWYLRDHNPLAIVLQDASGVNHVCLRDGAVKVVNPPARPRYLLTPEQAMALYWKARESVDLWDRECLRYAGAHADRTLFAEDYKYAAGKRDFWESIAKELIK